jgi:hypothetical protein
MTDKMMFIEGEGGLFRGYCEDQPLEIWHPGSGWQPYTGGVKPQHWGSQVDEAEANEIMADLTSEAEEEAKLDATADPDDVDDVPNKSK